jgi:D-3-phosphoglycerate dehydrogenase
MKKVLIIDEMHESISSMLEEIAYQPTYLPTITRQEILDIIGDFEGIIIRSKTNIDKEILNKATNLKFIGRAGAGIDLIDIKEVEKRKIILFNAPEGNRDALAEHTIGLLLALTNNIVKADKQVRGFHWERESNRGHEIGNLTVGLFGYGNMAQAFAKRLSSFGCKVLAYDKYKTNYANEFAQESTIEEIQEKANILSLHTPLTSETNGYINLSFFQKFKNNIWFLNTSRGEIAPIRDVLTLLETGKIRGASLDVLQKEKFNLLTTEEKITYELLFKQPNVIFSPHVAGWSFESYLKINEVLVTKIKNSSLLKR